MRFSKALQAVLISLLFFLNSSIFAQQESGVHPLLNSKYAIQAGVYFPSKDFRIGVDGSVSGDDQDFDFDEVAKLRDSDEVFALEFKWRFGEKWSSSLQYFKNELDGKAVLEEDIEWGDRLILAGSSVTAGTHLELTRVFFGRSFNSRDKVDTGIGLGIHWLDIGAFVRTEVNGVPGEKSTADVSGPLPNIGAWYHYSPAPKWLVGGRIDWLDASYDKYDGSIINFAAGANYQLFKYVGVGVKYQLFRLNVDINNKHWHGSAKLDYDGAFVYLSAQWK